jgi:glyoxylase-like metal-dependent hydrolase (beta-lactamase superfamily II)
MDLLSELCVLSRRVSVPGVVLASLSTTALTAQRPAALDAWQSGSAAEPVLRVQALAPDMWVIRQGKRSNAEAPFMYLIAGTRRALLLDTGARATDGRAVPLVATVDSLLATLPGARRPDSLLVLHSHGHGDHRAHDAQLAARPNTHVIAADTAAIMAALNLREWPSDIGHIALGDRELLVLPTPGHERAHLMLYDARTKFLFGGDMLYPGLLTVRDLAAFRASVERLTRFAATHPIRAVLGAHVEMSATPGRMYTLGTIEQPDEHTLALPATSMRTLARMVRDAGDFVGELYDDDIALARITTPSKDPPSTHGMLLFGRERLFLSHLPMARSPHDYQLVFEAVLPDSVLQRYRLDATQHDSVIYTVEPTQRWVLPNTIRRDTVFTAHLYRGHFERGGARIASDVMVRVRRVIMFRRFESDAAAQPDDWFSVGEPHDRYLVHWISGQGDADQVMRVCGSARRMRDGAHVRVTPTERGVRVGTVTPVGRVCRAYYEEREDLAAP